MHSHKHVHASRRSSRACAVCTNAYYMCAPAAGAATPRVSAAAVDKSRAHTVPTDTMPTAPDSLLPCAFSQCSRPPTPCVVHCVWCRCGVGRYGLGVDMHMALSHRECMHATCMHAMHVCTYIHVHAYIHTGGGGLHTESAPWQCGRGSRRMEGTGAMPRTPSIVTPTGPSPSPNASSRRACVCRGIQSTDYARASANFGRRVRR